MQNMTALLKIGLVSASDRASQGVYQDQGILKLQAWLRKARWSLCDRKSLDLMSR